MLQRPIPWAAICLALMHAAMTTAQESGPMEFSAGLEGQLYENFFQAVDGSPKKDVTGLAARIKVEQQLAAPDLEGYGRLRVVDYSDFDPSADLVGGLRRGPRPHGFDVSLGFRAKQPTLEVGDELDEADTVWLEGEYSYRLSSDFQINGLLSYRDQSFGIKTGNDNDNLGYGASVRYRGWGSKFSPEVGVVLGERDARDDSEDLDQTDLILKIRSAPSPRLYLSLRFRLRDRDYTVANPAASNFGRNDDRTDWTLAASYRQSRRLSLSLYFSYLDADSTRESRIFTTQNLFVGAEYRF